MTECRQQIRDLRNRLQRRGFLSDMGLGVTGLALGELLGRDNRAFAAENSAGAHAGAEEWKPADGTPHFAPKIRSVIWVFLSGGVSHMETFDPKPALNRYAGMTFEETGLPNPIQAPFYLSRSRSVVGDDRQVHRKIWPLQVGYRPHGNAGIEVSHWLPHLASCVDDLCIVRSMWTTDNDHAAEFQMHTGRHALDEREPVIGSWVHYGLSALNENLPRFVFLGEFKDNRVRQNFDPYYLGPSHGGIQLSLDPKAPLPFGVRSKNMLADEQRNEFELVAELNRVAAAKYPDDEQLRARIQSYELAFRMQSAVPEAMDLTQETQETQQMYGIGNPVTEVYGRRLLAARRLAERGVRYSLVYLSDYGEWDSHQQLKQNHARSCERVDRPLAGLVNDLKQRGLLDETLVVCCTEFGRTPAVEAGGMFNAPGTGRDHHPHGFTVWFAGGGLKKGYVHGATDELGFHAVENPHYVTDIHATVLHLLGLDRHRLEIPGHKRLDIDHGQVIHDIIA